MLSIEKILNKMFVSSNTYNKKTKEKTINFWSSISNKEIQKISDVVLQKPGTKLSYLDKYNLDELNIILKMFPLEQVNEQIQSNLKLEFKNGVCKLNEYRIYNININLINNIKNYKKARVKIDKENKGKK